MKNPAKSLAVALISIGLFGSLTLAGAGVATAATAAPDGGGTGTCMVCPTR
jgi:hypothetical protein